MAFNLGPRAIKFHPNIIALILLLTILFSNVLKAQDQTLSTIGDVLIFAMPATALSSTIITGDEKGTWQFTKAFVVNQALTIGLKMAIDKPRPDLSNNASFPSGHSSTTFQSAAFIQKRYGWKYCTAAYALAGFTAYSRIQADKHDGWDVLAGAIIGVGSSYIFTTQYQKEHLEITFNSSDDNYLLGFKYKF
ncbi:phosphatase PAP2 family protein [Arenibacter sp. ARW7G5Y1]|uniref:phosphatase PAP2 family protein n=1 Tax=Arenibacter sp. ARW7G5Y1 TaxID=2135619 RepID=UPI000D7608CA|nr:phosphatase PAP2 family protein [Arenibacter sp. ARW7G5Y1]PXX30704.1 membrane-associated phospholipid phosphatase [Arenibacter sp. ARW7G5Y1]